jgi:O-acetyl-ADP-ribose deacetylase (regulator of RNase III)
MPEPGYWTQPSVIKFAQKADPVATVLEKARGIVLEALESGWSGPPFDILDLAKRRGIEVSPRGDVLDARTIPSEKGKALIEFNPNRPARRVRFSVAHELAHTLFPDWDRRVRNRLTHEEMKGDDWQLEMLCNLAAAEMLMPIGSLRDLGKEDFSVDLLLELRKKFEVSAEAVFLRVAHVTEKPCVVFAASVGEEGAVVRYRVDYALNSKGWSIRIASGFQLPKKSVVEECTAIGFTAKRKETWASSLSDLQVECVGIPPYPNRRYPRVLGFLKPNRDISDTASKMLFLRGDATKPRGSGTRLVAHIVNDKTPNWGRGFGVAARRAWPSAQEHFREWVVENPAKFKLGSVCVSEIDESLGIVHMICQRGYGPSPSPRIRYSHLKTCLMALCEIAQKRNATVHMPRIGSGEAGGSWDIVSELVEDALCNRGIQVTVYDLPGSEIKESEQRALNFVQSVGS